MNTIKNSAFRPVYVEISFGKVSDPDCGSAELKPGEKINTPDGSFIEIMELPPKPFKQEYKAEYIKVENEQP